ncbi:hypothetical protein ACNI4H_18225 [Klebsiella aerogenes]|uniref:hypothetical protein n=1 Tax=Klebsiella aerogenes TaxID=548 RepID=UPI003A86C656
MTNNQLTKEWLQQTIAELESVRDEIPFGIDTNSELELAAFKIALAAMDGEPVAWTDEEELRDANKGGSGYLFGIGHDANKFADPRRQIMLYRHAQPAPVVPTFDEWLELRGNKPLGWVKDAMRESYDACRAAMLQPLHTIKAASALGALPKTGEVLHTNSPVIPDGWKLVPVEPNGDMLAAAQDAYGETDGDIASTLRAAMLAAAQPAPTIQVTDAMAYAFHHALTDGPLGDDDVEDIKTGLRAAFATLTIKQPEPVVPVEATIDNKPNSSYEWRKGWNACLAAMLAVAPPAPKSTVK